MNRLIALDMAGGQLFVDALQRIWDAGDAVLPIDRRLPVAAKHHLLDRLRPAAIVTSTGTERIDGGRDVAPGDALVVATSGTTGDPKGVTLTHDAVAASAAATSGWLGVTDRDRWLACLPLSHVGGLSVVTRALHTGTPLTVHERFDADAVLAAADDGATLVSLVATALGRIDPTRFRTIVLGGGRPPDDRPPNTVITYGMTETGSGVVYDRRPLDGVELRIVDGEVQLRCPMLLRCYRGGEPFEIDPRTADGWFATGDLGTFDDGVLHIDGRRGDLIITGGENVWPEPIEAIVNEMPGVAAVAVAGVDDPEWGQAVTVYVVPDGAAPTLDAVRAAVKEQLPPFCAPRRLELIEALPLTALGKVQRSRLSAGSRHDRTIDPPSIT